MAFGFHFTTPYTPGGQDVLEDPSNPINAGTLFTATELSSASVNDAYFVDSNGDGVIADADTDDTDSYIGFAGDAVNIGTTTYQILEMDRDGDMVSYITYNGVQMGAMQGVVFEVFYLDDGSHFIAFSDSSIAALAAQSGGVFNPALISAMYLERTATGDEGGIAASAFADVVCFASGTLIAVPGGAVPVEALRPGDKVLTLHNGPQTLRWVGCRKVGPWAARARPNLRPVRIAAGALGRGLPLRDLLVSRQHRILIETGRSAAATDRALALVAAVRLLPLAGVGVETGPCAVAYHHLLFDRHEVVFAEGTPCESLLIGDQAVKALGAVAMGEIQAALGGPHLAQGSTGATSTAAAWVPQRKMQKQLVAIQQEAGRPLAPRPGLPLCPAAMRPIHPPGHKFLSKKFAKNF